MQILVLSCDKNEDLFYPFHHCIEKYWPNHPEVIYTTETVVNPYYRTICKNYPLSNWTTRIRETVKELEDDIIYIICDDVFIRYPVNEERLNYILDTVMILPNTGSFISNSSHFNDDIKTEYTNVVKRAPNGQYKTSVMCSL